MAVFTSKASMDRFKKMEKLGEGTYGLVYKAKDLEKNTYVAIKKIKMDHSEEGISATTIREISLLKGLIHRNIVTIECSLCLSGELYLVFEFLECDLKGYLDKLKGNQYLSSTKQKEICYYMLEGMRYCHSRRVLHRDMKPQNLLLTKDGNIKIADFGLGRQHSLPIGKLTHEVVTLWYRSPEILLGSEKYSGACDIWSIGCIAAEVATKVPLFPGDAEIDQLFQIYRVMGTPNEDIWPGLNKLPDYNPRTPKWKKKSLIEQLNHKLGENENLGADLLDKLLVYDPNFRLTAKTALLHEWFDEIREDMIQKYGNVYPHCGSEKFQTDRFHQKQRVANNNISNSDFDQDEDIDV